MKRLLKIIFCVLFSFLATLNISAQKAEIYQVVPESQKAVLQERLTEYVNANTDKQWDKVYELIVPHFKSATDEELKMGVFVIPSSKYFKSKRHDPVKKFTPQETRKMGEDFYEITGCGTFKKSGQRLGTVWAFFEKGTWYFSDITIMRRYFSKEPYLCQH